jgi:3-phenylpropionate/cinnamic acid dioxygenase small subunit
MAEADRPLPNAPMPQGEALLSSVTAFLQREARLLDEQKWLEWDALFTADGIYWMPAFPGQSDHRFTTSLMLDTPLLRTVRLKRFSSPEAYSLQPFPRSVHFVSNVDIDAVDAAAGAVQAFSKALSVVSQGDIQTVFAGLVRHDLVWDGQGWKMAMKRVELVNCDSAHNSIHLYV